jgi:trans-aconitate methyltransferase
MQLIRIIKKDIDFWEKDLKDYEKQVISVFNVENILIEELKKIKNKHKKIVADLGCGVGDAFKYLKEFKKVYAIDFSKNMISKAKKIKMEMKFL